MNTIAYESGQHDGPFEWNGRLVAASFRIDVLEGTHIILQCTSLLKKPKQLLRLCGHKCNISIWGKTMSDGYIEPENLRDPVTIRIVDTVEGAAFIIWNTLAPTEKHPSGLSLIGNFGVAIEDGAATIDGRHFVLKFNYDTGDMRPPEFKAMTVALTVK